MVKVLRIWGFIFFGGCCVAGIGLVILGVVGVSGEVVVGISSFISLVAV